VRRLFAVLLLGCAPTTTLPDPGAPPNDATQAATAPAVGGSSDPRVSRSAGEPGGVVVLWPRIIPAGEVDSTRMIAGLVQDRMKELVERTLPGRAIDVRPDPERTCPQAGCAAVALGVLIVRDGDGCAVVGFVMPPGTTEATTLVPWAGGLTLKRSAIPFRAHPESEVSVSDFGRCNDLPASLAEHEADVAAALTAAAGR
jgi:hypothetical protein